MGKLKINLLGTSFTIQANEETEYLEKLLGYYERITKDVSKIESVKTPLQISILSGIMLCDELYKEKKISSQLKDETNLSSVQDIIQNNISEEELQKITLEMINKIDKVL